MYEQNMRVSFDLIKQIQKTLVPLFTIHLINFIFSLFSFCTINSIEFRNQVKMKFIQIENWFLQNVIPCGSTSHLHKLYYTRIVRLQVIIICTSSSPQLSMISAQCQQLMNLLNQHQIPHPSSTSTVGNLGILNPKHLIFSAYVNITSHTNLKNHTQIIDTGVTDHISCSSMFTTITIVVFIHVKLPDGSITNVVTILKTLTLKVKNRGI